VSWINTSPTEALLSAVKCWATPMWTGFANVDDFNRDFQRLATEYCWGRGMGRREFVAPRAKHPHPRHGRCDRKMDEFSNHLRGAPANGLTPNELRAVLVQIAIYCGIPVSADCFRVADTILSESKG
jgi:4-carboxymuconolactone decarboxylase